MTPHSNFYLEHCWTHKSERRRRVLLSKRNPQIHNWLRVPHTLYQPHLYRSHHSRSFSRPPRSAEVVHHLCNRRCCVFSLLLTHARRGSRTPGVRCQWQHITVLISSILSSRSVGTTSFIWVPIDAHPEPAAELYVERKIVCNATSTALLGTYKPSTPYEAPSRSHEASLPLAVNAIPDVLWTSLLALKEYTDAFPPLKTTVGGIVALLEIAEEILDLIADAVPDASAIPLPLLKSIERFILLLNEIRCRMETIVLTGGVSRVMHLNRNERVLQDIKAQLDDAYRDFLAASALRLEVQQAHLTAQQAHLTIQQTQLAARQVQTHKDVGKVFAAILETPRSPLQNRLRLRRGYPCGCGCIRLHSPAIPPFSPLSIKPSLDALSLSFSPLSPDVRARSMDLHSTDADPRSCDRAILPTPPRPVLSYVPGTWRSSSSEEMGADVRLARPPQPVERLEIAQGPVQCCRITAAVLESATQTVTQAHASASGACSPGRRSRRAHEIALALRMHPHHLALGGVAHVLVVRGAGAASREGERKFSAPPLPVERG
ncbi:hypothetical protein C8R44DRAFT_991335 [Mycena epipterygia]|nr:hypothetical protein C8R44DRAFT_991335 [Mycena epipterygia]